jgi:methylamine---glutamate N-methyltransferase subunit B
MNSEDDAGKPFENWSVEGLSSEQIDEKLRQAPENGRVKLIGLTDRLAGVGSGLSSGIDVIVDGDVGPFAWMLGQNLSVQIDGNAGVSCGHSMHSGSILIRGDSGDFLGAYAVGGLIAVHGKSGSYVGYGLSGADLVIRSRCGKAAGAAMRSGLLVIGNGAGENLGAGMSGGTIYVRGSIVSVARQVQSVPMGEADSLRLGLLLARAGLKAKADEFQMFRANH